MAPAQLHGISLFKKPCPPRVLMFGPRYYHHLLTNVHAASARGMSEIAPSHRIKGMPSFVTSLKIGRNNDHAGQRISRHVCIAEAPKARCVLAEIRAIHWPVGAAQCRVASSKCPQKASASSWRRRGDIQPLPLDDCFGSSRDKEAVFVNDRFGSDFCRSPLARTTITLRPSWFAFWKVF